MILLQAQLSRPKFLLKFVHRLDFIESVTNI